MIDYSRMRLASKQFLETGKIDFETIFQDIWALLLQFFKDQGLNEWDAEDAAAEVVQKLVERERQGRPQYSVLSRYLATVARSEAVTVQRRVASQNATVCYGLSGALEEVKDPNWGPESEIVWGHMLIWLLRKSGISFAHQQTFLLRLYGHDTKELAADAGLTDKAIYTRYMHAQGVIGRLYERMFICD